MGCPGAETPSSEGSLCISCYGSDEAAPDRAGRRPGDLPWMLASYGPSLTAPGTRIQPMAASQLPAIPREWIPGVELP